MLARSGLQNQQGYTLVELIIASAIGLVSVTTLASFVGMGIGMNAQALLRSRLVEEVNMIASLIEREVKRAGYSATSERQLLGQTPLVFSNHFTLSAFHDEPESSCILYSYDADENGIQDTDNGSELFGFRLHDKAIEIRQGGASCDDGGWHDLSDPQQIEITQFEGSLDSAITNGYRTRFVSITLGAKMKNGSKNQYVVSKTVLVQNYGE